MFADNYHMKITCQAAKLERRPMPAPMRSAATGAFAVAPGHNMKQHEVHKTNNIKGNRFIMENAGNKSE